MATGPVSKAPKPFVFVLMPFAGSFRDTYELGIKQACMDAGAYCERVDEQCFDGSILDRIYNQIAKADVIVSDMTGRNPNVFYETGYAHALGKRTILLTQSSDDIPFDLKHFTHIVYGGSIVTLKKDLHSKIQWAINNPEKSLIDPLSVLCFRLSGREILENAEFEISVMLEATQAALASGTAIPLGTQVKIDVQNVQDRPFNAADIEIAIEVPSVFASTMKDVKAVDINEGRSLIALSRLERFLPYSWQSLSVRIPNRVLRNYTDEPVAFGLHVFSEMGKRVVRFVVRFRGDAGEI